jgi:hypothetical protein
MLRSRRLLLGILAVAAIAVAGVLIVRHQSRGIPTVAALPPLPPLAVVPGTPAVVVAQAAGNEMLLQTAAGARSVTLPTGLHIELLRPAPASAIQIGDWLSIGGAANQINSIALKQVVLIPAAEAISGVDPHQPPRSRDGFTGFEGESDATIGPALYGRVRSISGSSLTLDGPDGALSVHIPPEMQILRLQTGDAAAIRDGDRLVFAGGDPATATAVLAR